MFSSTIARRIGYSLFFLFSFVLGLYLTFPWSAAKEKIFAFASKQVGTKITAQTLEPSWITGVEMNGVEIGEVDPIVLDKVRARVHLLPFLTGKQGFSVWLPIGKGEIDADVTMGPEIIDVDAHIAKVQLDQVAPLLAASGLPLIGTVDLTADLTLGKKDPKLTHGKIVLTTEGLAVEKGGKMGMVPVPELTLGNLKLEVPITDGKIEFKNTRVPGTDVEISLDGSIALNEVIGRSSINLMLGIKPTEKLLGSDPLLRPILKNFDSAKDSEGFYGLAITGTLQNRKTTPRRR